jgi:hypothetical protein
MDNKSLKIKDDVKNQKIIDIEMDIDENKIEQYTDEHFMNRLNNTLEPYSSSPNIMNNGILTTNDKMLNTIMSINKNSDIRASNSPMTLSKSGSESSFEASDDTDRVENTLNETKQRLSLFKSYNDSSIETTDETSDETDREENTLNKTKQSLTLFKSSKKPGKKHFHNLSLKEVERSLETFDTSCKLSNELDIIITYLNGQKNLYIHSKNFTNCKLNVLMVPTLIISTVVAVLSQFICLYGWSTITISILNATITLLISLVNYFKLESSTQIYSHMASQYDKLQTVLELANGRLIFLDNEIEQNKLIVKTIQEFEIKISEIKDSSTIFIPEDIKSIFPIISHINIFSFIKRIETYKKSLIYKYRDAKNEMRYILYKIDPEKYDERCKSRMVYLVDIKTRIRDELIEYKTIYSYMDDAFIQEIKNAEEQKFWCMRRIYGNKPSATQPDILKKHIPKL